MRYRLTSMPWFKLCFLLGIAVLILVLLMYGILKLGSPDRDVTVYVEDAVSGSWVWKAEVTLNGKKAVGHYMTDFRFTGISGGLVALTVSAPGYQSESIDLKLPGGKPEKPVTVSMTGLSIPGLAGFRVREYWENGRLSAELRPLNDKGEAIRDHPCLDLKVFVRISLPAGVAERGETQTQGLRDENRGMEIAASMVPWFWDSRPESLFRYRFSLPGEPREYSSLAPFVVDYLIFIPDPETDTPDRMEILTREITHLWETGKGIAAIQNAAGEVPLYIITNWNVGG
jgi:hypothetical protein